MKKLLLTFISTTLILINGCQKDDFPELDAICPEVLLTDPADGETDVPAFQEITVTFNEEMNSSTINSQSFTVVGTTPAGIIPVEGSITASGATAVFRPINGLSLNSTYTAKITTAVKDPTGNALRKDYIWSFSTGGTIGPSIVSTDPASDATGVPLNKTISATFNLFMDPATITSTNFIIKNGTSPVEGTISYDNKTAHFKPLNPLNENAVYTATITAGVKSSLGTPLAADYVWSFTAGTVNSRSLEVISTEPASNATGVALGTEVKANFSATLNCATINSATVILMQGSTQVQGTITCNGSSVTFVPLSPLAANATYTGRLVASGIKDGSGVGMDRDYIWTFSTGATVAPSVVSTDPPNNAKGISLTTGIKANFNMQMDPLTLNASSFVVSDGNTIIPGVVLTNGLSASFAASASLKPNTRYTVTITRGAKNLAGIPLVNDHVWSFTTLAITTPLVLSTDPVNNAVGVTLNKVISARFNVPMDPLSINNTSFTVREGANVVAGAALSNGVTASFTSYAALKANTVYTVTISKSARSALGVGMTNDYVWSFTTGSVSGTVPTIISTDPLNNAVGVVLNKVISATFSEPMDPMSLNPASFIVKEGANVVPGLVVTTGATVSFTAYTTLKANTPYTVTIKANARSMAGVAMANDYVWSFTSASATVPLVLSTDPLNNATGVALNKTISATFSVAMNPLTLNNSTFTLHEGGNAVPGVVVMNGLTASFTAAASLKPNAVYTATLTTGVKSMQGVSLGSNHVWVFTTANANVPVVISTDPIHNAVGVVLDKVIKAVFNVPVDPATITPSTFIVKAGAEVVAGVPSVSGATISFNANAALKANTLYTVTLTTGIKSMTGVSLASNHVWAFTTLSLTAPIVISTDPLHNAVGVLLNKVISAVFNVPMDPLTLTPATFILREGANVVPGLVVTLGATATFTTYTALKPNTLYTATIKAGVKSQAGMTLAADVVWNFTTKATISPTVIDLKAAAQFGILAGTGITNTGLSIINNADVGLYPGIRSLISGFPPGQVINGSILAADDVLPVGTAALLLQAKADLSAAIALAQGLNVPEPELISGDQGGKTFTPGIYKSLTSALVQNGNVILDAQGDANAVFIFVINSGLTTVGGAGGNITLTGGAQAKNVFWIVGNSASIGGNTNFYGNILANASINMGAASTSTGRLLAVSGSVVLANANTISKP